MCFLCISTKVTGWYVIDEKSFNGFSNLVEDKSCFLSPLTCDLLLHPVDCEQWWTTWEGRGLGNELEAISERDTAAFLGISLGIFLGFFLQIAFVFTQVGERDKSSVGCGKKIVLGGMKGSL